MNTLATPEPIVLSATYMMEKVFPFSITLLGQTHDLEIKVHYENVDNLYDDNFLTDVKIAQNTPCYFGKKSDVGDITHTMIGDWFDDIFEIEGHTKEEDAQIVAEIDAVFEQVWDFINEKGMG